MPIDPRIPLGADIGPAVDPYKAFDYALRMRQAKRLEEQDAQEAQYRTQLLSERQQAMAQQTQDREDKQKATQDFDATMQRVFASGEPSSIAVQKELVASGNAHLFPLIEPHLKAFDEAAKRAEDAKQEAAVKMGLAVHEAGNTPQAFQMAVGFLKRAHWTDEELAPYEQAVAQDPQNVSFITRALAGKAIPKAELETTHEPTEVGLAMRAAGGNEQAQTALKLFREGKATSTNPTEASLALAAAQGDPAAMAAFKLLNAKPAGAGPKPRPVTSGDAGKLAQINSSLMQLDSLRKRLAGTHTTGTMAAIGAGVWKPITDITGFGIEAKEKQAGIDLVKQIIGKALEGGVLRKEDEAKYAKILPTIGDTPAVVSSKLDGLEAEIKSHKANTLDALSDAGYDVSKYSARAELGGGVGGAKPKVGEVKTFPNGKRGRWDGQGWELLQ